MKDSKTLKTMLCIVTALLIISIAVIIMLLLNRNGVINGSPKIDKALVGTWWSHTTELVIREDGTLVWTQYTSGNEKPYIWECQKGYVKDNVIYFDEHYTSEAQFSAKADLYYSADEIPPEKWDTSKKTGGLEIVLTGDTIRLKKGPDYTQANFVRQ